MGQGAGMAIEDGVVLARAIVDGRQNLEEAFRIYEQKRQDRVQRLLEAVRWNARMFRAGNPLRRAGLDLGFWLMSKLRPTGPQETFAWVYEYDALRA
jgi:salicylate hydroxylase